MGMTHLLARMKSLLREQTAWQETGDDESSSNPAGDHLDSLPEGFEEETDPAAADEGFTTAHEGYAGDMNQEGVSASAPDQAPDEEVGEDTPGDDNKVEAESDTAVSAHEDSDHLSLAMCQHGQPAPALITDLPLSHTDGTSEEHLPQAAANFTHNPVYTTSPSTPAAGHPRLSMLSATRFADASSTANIHDETAGSLQLPVKDLPSTSQAHDGMQADPRQTDQRPASQYNQHPGGDSRDVKMRDASSMSRDELIATIQDLEQLVAAGQMALADTEERLALSQHRLQVQLHLGTVKQPSQPNNLLIKIKSCVCRQKSLGCVPRDSPYFNDAAGPGVVIMCLVGLNLALHYGCNILQLPAVCRSHATTVCIFTVKLLMGAPDNSR